MLNLNRYKHTKELFVILIIGSVLELWFNTGFLTNQFIIGLWIGLILGVAVIAIDMK